MFSFPYFPQNNASFPLLSLALIICYKQTLIARSLGLDLLCGVRVSKTPQLLEALDLVGLAAFAAVVMTLVATPAQSQHPSLAKYKISRINWQYFALPYHPRPHLTYQRLEVIAVLWPL